MWYLEVMGGWRMNDGSVAVKVAQTGKMSSVVADLQRGDKVAAVARRYGLKPATVRSFKRGTLASAAYKLRINAEDGAKVAIVDAMDAMRRMVDAQTEWMTDPDDPSKFTATPRADELMVVYEEKSDDGSRAVRRKDTLQHLLDRVFGSEESPCKVRFTGADSRLVFIKAMDSYRGMIDTLAKLSGVTADATSTGIQVNVLTQKDAALRIQQVRDKMVLELAAKGESDAVQG